MVDVLDALDDKGEELNILVGAELPELDDGVDENIDVIGLLEDADELELAEGVPKIELVPVLASDAVPDVPIPKSELEFPLEPEPEAVDEDVNGFIEAVVSYLVEKELILVYTINKYIYIRGMCPDSKLLIIRIFSSEGVS